MFFFQTPIIVISETTSFIIYYNRSSVSLANFFGSYALKKYINTNNTINNNNFQPFDRFVGLQSLFTSGALSQVI